MGQGRMRLVDDHERACDGFAAVTVQVPDDRWAAPTPCTEWDARALVEHVIGFHEFLLLRPMGVRANRPKGGPPAERWRATQDALFAALRVDGAIDRETELPGGGTSRPRDMLAALTNDVLVHTWDLGVATGVPVDLDPELAAAAFARVDGTDPGRSAGMVGPEVPVGPDAPVEARLLGCYGRDPEWRPPR
jgi:uncharacterized protein (TIGR03086 family)